MGAGTFTSSVKMIIYSGGQAHFRGVEIIFNKQTLTAIKGYRAIVHRMLMIKLQGKLLDMFSLFPSRT